MAVVVVGRDWCLSRFSIIKWLEIIFSCVIIGLIAPGTNFWEGYAYMIAVGAISLIVAFFSMVYYFAGFHKTYERVPYVGCEAFLNILCVLLNIVCFGLAIYDTQMMYNGNWNVHGFPDRSYVWRDRLTAVAVISGLNAILFFLSCTYADQQHFKIAFWSV